MIFYVPKEAEERLAKIQQLRARQHGGIVPLASDLQREALMRGLESMLAEVPGAVPKKRKK